ncbi:hypothetical protein GGR44_003299 [Sphingobium fontiphilum]|uniref:Sulfotransferase family protein n=1 Tax=Sphingobium fontiphilum TaxID=944425 RepID=A0A7W6DIC8_9SPHN|nr:hypothetical protein [Sphingobium fontiphilum]
MVISDNPAFLFVHIPKTAGTSLSRALLRVAGGRHPQCLATTKHETLAAFAARVGRDAVSSRVSFAVVRNPLMRFASHFRYLKTQDVAETRHLQSLDDYARAVESGDPAICKPARIAPQHSFIALDGEIGVDHVFRFETLDRDMGVLAQRLGLGAIMLPHLNMSRHSAETPSAYVRAMVSRYYADDFRIFGYSLPDCA